MLEKVHHPEPISGRSQLGITGHAFGQGLLGGFQVAFFQGLLSRRKTFHGLRVQTGRHFSIVPFIGSPAEGIAPDTKNDYGRHYPPGFAAKKVRKHFRHLYL